MSLKLENAPIIEAVLEFYCELPPGQNRGGWEAALKERFASDYPECHTQYLQQFQLQMAAGAGKPTTDTVRQGVHGYRHLKADGRQLIQCRIDGFFFNRLAPYTSFDDYLPEALRCWSLYCEVAEPVVVRQVGLRYINRLLLPVVDGKLSMGKYFENPPRTVTPSEHYDFTFTGFVHQHQIADAKSKTVATVVLAAEPFEADKLPVVFEIAAVRAGNFSPADHAAFVVALQSLRDLKNHVFQNTLTPTCLTLFQ
jgi:uncharacterized protein (TIGR04255 family)